MTASNKKCKIKKGDKVAVISGFKRGEKGEVVAVYKSLDKITVLVKGVNIVKCHVKPNKTNPGGIISKEAPIDISNVAVCDPKDGKPTKVGYKLNDDGKKLRFAKRSGEFIDV